MFKSVSIIIPALNEEAHISKCLKAIAGIDRNGLDVETIVVDNGSTDRTAELAREHGAKVLLKAGVNVAAVRNHGVQHSNGDLLAFVDADCVVAKEWLTQAIKVIERESADAVGSFHLIPDEAGWIGRTAELAQSKKVGIKARYIPSGNLLVKRQCFEAVGGFNAFLETSEDVDFCERLRKKGYKIFLDPEIRSTHLGSPMNLGEMFRREMWHGKTMLPVFLSDLRTGKSLLSARNLNLLLFSGANLLLIIGMLAGVYALFKDIPDIFVASASLYLLLNFAVAILNWLNIRKNLAALFGYILIYGVARSSSLLGSIFSTCLSTSGSSK